MGVRMSSGPQRASRPYQDVLVLSSAHGRGHSAIYLECPPANGAATTWVLVTLSAMATAKQDARKILDSLPEEASLEDIQYHLYVLQRIHHGREDVEAGRVVTQDEVEQRLARWLDE